MTFGEAALKVFIGEIGNGEEGSNNSGFHCTKYMRGAKPRGGGAWCAWVLFWCLEIGWEGLGNTSDCPILRSGGAHQAFNRCARYGRRLDSDEVPAPGDIMLWKSSIGYHINMCHSLIKNKGKVTGFYTIDGNRGRYPSKVRTYKHRWPRPVGLKKVARV